MFVSVTHLEGLIVKTNCHLPTLGSEFTVEQGSYFKEVQYSLNSMLCTPICTDYLIYMY